MEKREGGTVAPSVVVGDVEAVLRGIKRRISLRLLCFFCRRRLFVPCEAWPSEALVFRDVGLTRHGLPRHWPSEAWSSETLALRGAVLRGMESCETWGRKSLVAWVGVGEVVEWKFSRC
jgi:hypothetical protein